DYQTALGMLQAIGASGVTPIARVPWNEPGIIMKLLDAGALGIICPMVNTAQDAADFVGAMRYAPEGFRSSGPTRAAIVHGGNYHHEANDTLVSFAMVETKQAFSNLDEIAATDGLTGIYIGPSDLSVSMGYNPGLDRTEAEMDDMFGTILASCKAHGLKCGIHCGSADYAKSAFERGFDFATLASDVRLFSAGINAAISQMK
ncbi:MAG: HpcH/HpaI aldolase family protein, partial [Candidatus Puniceispirillaceae bacterium]